jgi:hypothetical protein
MADSPMTYAERYDATAADIALFYAGEPEERVASSLSAMAENMKRELSELFVGTDVNIPEMVDRFIDAILERKTEIERDVNRDGHRPKMN